MSAQQRPVWALYVATAIWFAVVAGFGLGGGLFAVTALDRPIGVWWLGAAQAHAHVQITGWAGLMVLGVGMHFVPRLLGAASISPRLSLLALGLLVAGLSMRALSQPMAAARAGHSGSSFWQIALLTSAVLELSGISAALVALIRSLGRRVKPASSGEVRAVVPFFAVAIAGLAFSSMLNVAALAQAIGDEQALIGDRWQRFSVTVSYYGFLLPVAVAMSARIFPLYVRTRIASAPRLRVTFALLAAGLALRLAAIGFDRISLEGAANIILAMALMVVALVTGVFGGRSPLPRRQVRVLDDPIQLHMVTASLWLLVAAVTLLDSGSSLLGGPSFELQSSIEWHALGAGYVSILIFGAGQLLLPGFAKRQMLDVRLLWVTLVLGNGAAMLRIIPVAFGSGWQHRESVLALSGVLAIAAVLGFAVNTRVFENIFWSRARIRDRTASKESS